MFRRTLLAGAAACALAAAPIAARAGPISGYPAAATPLSGSETVIGTQSGATVQITTQSIANIVTAATQSWTGVQTFPAPGASKGSIVLTPGTISGTPPNGSLWTTSTGVFAEVGGTTVSLIATGAVTQSGSVTANHCTDWASTGVIQDAGIGCGPGGASGQLQLNSTGAFAGASALNYSGTTLTDTGPLLLNTDNGTLTLKNTAGTGWFFAGMFGGAPIVSTTFGTDISIAGVGLSADGASGAILDIGNGTPGDTSGTLRLTTLKVATTIDLPSPNAGLVTPQIQGSVVKLYQPIDLNIFAGNGFAIPASADGLIAYGGAAMGGNGTLGLSIVSKSPGVEFCDEFSPYCTNRQFDLFSSTNGMQAIGLEAGPNNSQNLEIGLARDTGTITQISQLETLDWVIHAGGVQHYNITNGGSGYTAATATLATSGCTEAPTTPTVLFSGGVVYGLSGVDPGYGCSSVTVSISGTGTGATATTTLTTNPDAFPAGPQTMWHQPGITGFAPYLGMGQADLNPNRLLIGESDNQAKPWETTPSLQPTLVIPGHLEFDTANGAGHLGFTGGESFSDAGGGVLQLQNAALSANAGLQVGFERVVPTTVSGLATVDASPVDGDRAYVTNATACAFGSAVTGGGSTHCTVHYDGSSSSWKAG